MHPDRRLVDDGKRLDALDVALRCNIIYIREGVRGREGGVRNSCITLHAGGNHAKEYHAREFMQE